MGNRPISGKQRTRRGAPEQPPAPTPQRGRRGLWLLLAGLLLVFAGVWAFGGFALFPRAMADKSLTLRDYASAWRWTEIAGWLSYHDSANVLLAAKIARSQGDADRRAQELATARRWGVDRQVLRREELLALAQAGELEGIEAELVQCLSEAGAEGADISNAYANGLAMNARFDDALSVLEAWRKDFPSDPRPDYRLGRLEEHRELYVEAEASYRRALARNARFYPARYSLGRVLLHERRVEEAAEVFRACLNSPYPEAVQVELAIALKALGRADEARPLFKQVLAAPERLEASYLALDEQPEGFKAAAEYGKLQADAGDYAAAEPWLAKALAVNPLDLMARYAFAVTLRSLGKRTEAEREFARVAASREAMGAAAALNTRIKADPRDLEARYLLGKAILENESERTGLYWLRSIFTFDPEYAPAHELLADYFAAKPQSESQNARLAGYHRRMAAASRKATAP